MKVSTKIDNNLGYEKNTQLVDNIPLTNSGNSVTGITLKPPNITYYIVTDTQFQELLYYLV